MSSKTVGIIVVIVILGIGLWLMMKKGEEGYSNTMVPAASQNGGENSSMTASVIGAGDTSDSALSRDAATIDAQMGSLDADAAAAASAE